MHPFYQDKQERFQCFPIKNIHFPAHLHRAVELVYLSEGALEATVHGQTKTIQKDEAALIFPDIVHSYRTTDHCRGILCIFPPAHAKEYFHLFHRQQPECPFLACGDHSPDLPFLFQRMLSYAGQSPALGAAWLNLILAFLMPGLVLVPRDSQADTDISYQVISYVSQHFREPLTLDLLAGALHFNKYYISRVFTGSLHCGFHAYLNRLRLDYAAKRLQDTNLSITEIWQEAGFESQRTFNRTFLDCYKTTPSQYRKTAGAARLPAS